MKTMELGRMEKKYGLSKISLRRHVKELWKKFARKMGVEHFPDKIKFMKYPEPAKMRTIPSKGDPVETLEVNYPVYRRVYPEIPEKTEKQLRFTVAHEVGHVKQAEEAGIPAYAFLEEREKFANRKAKEVTGITREKIKRLNNKLRRKFFEILGIPKERQRKKEKELLEK